MGTWKENLSQGMYTTMSQNKISPSTKLIARSSSHACYFFALVSFVDYDETHPVEPSTSLEANSAWNSSMNIIEGASSRAVLKARSIAWLYNVETPKEGQNM